MTFLDRLDAAKVAAEMYSKRLKSHPMDIFHKKETWQREYLNNFEPAFTLELIAKFEKMREALEWYADSSKWQDVHPSENRHYSEGEGVWFKAAAPSPGFIICEGGKKARDALKEIEEV